MVLDSHHLVVVEEQPPTLLIGDGATEEVVDVGNSLGANRLSQRLTRGRGAGPAADVEHRVG
ncbi:MAG: hypothetical protein ACRDTA_14125, partial [Pseudonocardiaceae bacterium]